SSDSYSYTFLFSPFIWSSDPSLIILLSPLTLRAPVPLSSPSSRPVVLVLSLLPWPLPLVSTLLPPSSTWIPGICSHLSHNICSSCHPTSTSSMFTPSAIGMMSLGVLKVQTRPTLFLPRRLRRLLMESTPLSKNWIFHNE